MNLEDLPEDARQHYEAWRGLGVGEAEALHRAQELAVQSELDERLESIMRQTRGPEYAKHAVRAVREKRGRTEEPDPFEELVGIFRRRGMSEAAARAAVVGRSRRTEAEVREEFAEDYRARIAESRAAEGPPRGPEALRRLTLDTASEAEFNEAVRLYASYGIPEERAQAILAEGLTQVSDADRSRWLRDRIRDFSEAMATRPKAEGKSAPSAGQRVSGLREVSRPAARQRTVALSETSRPAATTELPPLIVRADELVLQGLSEAAAARQAYREIYKCEPRAMT